MRYKDKTTGAYVWHDGNAKDPGGTNPIVLLLRPDGSRFYVAQSDLDKQYSREESGTANITTSDAVKELFLNMRYIGTIRFVAMPFFLGATGSLAYAHSQTFHGTSWAVPLAGILLSVVFIIFEIIFSYNLLSWWNKLENLLGKGEVWEALSAHRKNLLLKVGRYGLLTPYAVIIGYWIYKFLHLPPRKLPVLGTFPWQWSWLPWTAVIAIIACYGLACFVWSRGKQLPRA